MKQPLALLTLLMPLASLHAASNPVNPNKTMTPKTENMNEMWGDTAVKPLTDLIFPFPQACSAASSATSCKFTLFTKTSRMPRPLAAGFFTALCKARSREISIFDSSIIS